VSEIVFVLGAGASVHTGAPVMATFLENAKLLSKGITRDPWKSHFERVFKAINELQRVHSKAYFDIHNLEAVFTILETAQTIGKLPGFKPEEIPAVLDSFKSVITFTLDITTEFPVFHGADLPVGPDQTKPIQISPSPDYKRFVQLIQTPRCRVCDWWDFNNYFQLRHRVRFRASELPHAAGLLPAPQSSRGHD
jgi:hypothetical protein